MSSTPVTRNSFGYGPHRQIRDPGTYGLSDKSRYDTPIIDRGKFEAFGDAAAGLNPMADKASSFHRTDADRRPPSKVVTRDILGDPKPGRTPWAAPE